MVSTFARIAVIISYMCRDITWTEPAVALVEEVPYRVMQTEIIIISQLDLSRHKSVGIDLLLAKP